jgi:hypothetical protein
MSKQEQVTKQKFKVFPYQEQLIKDIESGKVKQMVVRKNRTKRGAW